MGIVRVKRKPDQRLGNDSVYGSGVDGNVTINGTFIMTRDYYWNNLTLNSESTLFTNGFRVFVKDALTMNPSSKVGMPSSITTVNTFGTVIGRAGDSVITKQYVIGDKSGATQVPQSIIKDLNFSIRGWHFDPVEGFRRAEGGGEGSTGADVAGASGGAAPNAPSGNAGNPGGAGGAGGNALAPATAGNPGGAGNPGTQGNAGTQGNPGNAGSAGTGGVGGDGGGMVLVVAKTIIYTGSSGGATIESFGRVGYAGAKGADGTVGGSGAAGTSGTDGVAGTQGNAGITYPARHVASTTNQTNHVVIGQNVSNRNSHNTTAHVASTPNHAPAHGGATVAQEICKADSNPATSHHTKSNSYHHHSHVLLPGSTHHQPTLNYHSNAIRSNAHHTVTGGGNPTGNHHCNYNYNPNHNHHTVTGHNLSSTNTHNVLGNHNATNPIHAPAGGNANPPSHNAAIPGGNAGQGGARGNAGTGGSAGIGGAAGIGGTGDTGTTGLRGGVLVVCDSISNLINATNGGYGTILLNS